MKYIEDKFGIHIKEALIPFVAGLIAHGYIMFSYSPNKDEFISIFHHGSGYDFGRWFHTAIGNFMFRIDGCYSMPWLNGLIYLLFISLAALLFAEPFGIKNKMVKYLFMILFMVFPVTTATLSYMATAPFYAFGIFLIALGFFVSIKYKYGFLFGIVTTCASIGIYQAYFALIAAFVFFFFFMKLLSVDTPFKESLITAVKQLVMLVAGLVAYFVINKVIISVKHINLTDYQNISDMGHYTVASMFAAFLKCYKDFFSVFTGDYYYIFPYKILSLIVLAAWVLFAVCLVYLVITNIKKNWINVIFIAVLTVLIPPAMYLINVMCADFISGIYTLMCYSAFFMYGAPLLILDLVLSSKPKIEKYAFYAINAALIFVVFIYIKYANMAYLAYDIHYDQAYFEFSSLATRIRSTEGYDDMTPIVFAGKFEDHSRLWELRYADALPGAYTTEYVMNGEDRRANFFRFFLGFTYAEVYPSDTDVTESAEFKEMPLYPDDGSIKKIDDCLVVKFSDIP